MGLLTAILLPFLASFCCKAMLSVSKLVGDYFGYILV